LLEGEKRWRFKLVARDWTISFSPIGRIMFVVEKILE
jgi:hypothetical protein